MISMSVVLPRPLRESLDVACSNRSASTTLKPGRNSTSLNCGRSHLIAYIIGGRSVSARRSSQPPQSYRGRSRQAQSFQMAVLRNLFELPPMCWLSYAAVAGRLECARRSPEATCPVEDVWLAGSSLENVTQFKIVADDSERRPEPLRLFQVVARGIEHELPKDLVWICNARGYELLIFRYKGLRRPAGIVGIGVPCDVILHHTRDGNGRCDESAD